MTNKEVLDDSFPQLLSLFFSVPCDSPGSRILVTVSCVMFSSLQSGVCCTEQPHLGDELSSRVAGSLPATVVDRYSCKPPCRREGLKCKMAFGGSPSNWRSVARQSANSLSSAAVSVVHFVSPAANCSSPSLGGSCTPSSSLLSRSEALLVTCGVFSILVDCPLDFRSLLPVFPQGFPVSSVFEVAEKPSFEAEGSGGLPTVASPNLPSVGIRAAPSLHADGKPEGVRLNHLCSSLWNPVRDSSPHQPDSLFSCALVRALLPVRLHAILITHPHGLLGLPLLCELVDIRETRVLVTPPVLAAAEPALRFLRLRESRDLWLRGNRELYRDDSRRKERVYRRGGEVGSAWQAREFETKNSPPLPFSSAAVGGEASPAAKGEERSTLGVRSSPRASSLGDAGEPEDCKLNESSAFLVRTRSSGSQLLAGVGVSAQISPTMFWQQQELLNDETQQRLQIHPVSSGYCLGGANWVITTASDQRILIVGPSAFDATGDNPSSSKIVHTPEVLARMPTTCGSARGKDTEAAFSPNTKGARYPLGPDWTVLSEASLVIFFDCAPLSGSPAIPSSFLFRLLESVPAEPHRGMSSSLSVSPAAGPYAAYSTGCSRPLLGQAGHSFVSPALTSCSHNPAPHHLRRFHQPALLRYDSQNHSGSPRASDSDSRPSNSLLASSYPPSCPLLPLSSSLRELSSLVLSTVRDRRGNVLIPIDPCGLLFLETIEVLSTITSSSSALLSAVPLYCVAPGLPGLLQFAAEGVEWMEETRAERTRDLQHPRPPLRLSACFDEELLLAGKSRPGASDLSMRNRSLIAGECLADIMPLREPCVLLLSDSSLRTGECALLLEKWKDEEKHLLVCIDRRFACRGDVKRPVLSPTSSGCESSQVGYH
ncbi:small subunit rrna synthesis-associated, partial [Cystoisospora suis]